MSAIVLQLFDSILFELADQLFDACRTGPNGSRWDVALRRAGRRLLGIDPDAKAEELIDGIAPTPPAGNGKAGKNGKLGKLFGA